MHCAHCQSSLQTALQAVKGVKTAIVSLEEKTAKVKYASDKTEPDALRAAVKAAGFEAE